MEKTLVTIPHYGSDDLLRELLDSAGVSWPAGGLDSEVTLIPRGDYTFLIVNNNTQNRGFTAGCNLGLEAMRRSPEPFAWTWLLNNDTAFESRTQFEASLAAMQAAGRARDWTIVAQQVRHCGQRDVICFGGAFECFPAGRHKSGSVLRGDWSEPTEERWLSFCSVLVRRDLVERIGLLDPELVTYYSDSDYSLRARAAGFRIGYTGAASYLFHRVGASARPNAAQVEVLRRDYLGFWQKWIAGPEHALYLRLMKREASNGDVPAGRLAPEASRFRELADWLGSLPPDQPLGLPDLLQHFQHRNPSGSFGALCNVTRALLEAE